MRDYKSLAHTKWDCNNHVVFIPKCISNLRKHAVSKVIWYIKGKSAIMIARQFEVDPKNWTVA